MAAARPPWLRLEPLQEASGHELSAATQKLLGAGYISPGPQAARQRIQQEFTCELTPSGDGCEPIEAIRRLILEVDPHLATALTIVATHTHWHEGDFILEQYDPTVDAYVIGPSQVLPYPVLWPITPISFVFHPDGPAPYEWSDASTRLAGQPDLDRLWSGLVALNAAALARFGLQKPIPLGVTTYHRFKPLWSTPSVGTSETPSRVNPAYATVTRTAGQSEPPPDSVQVGWSAFIVEEYTEREQLVIDAIERELARLQPADAADFLRELEAYARLHATSNPADA